MNRAACQKEAFSLAGLLSIVMVEAANLLSKLDIGNAWNLTKPDMRSRIAGGSIAFTDAKKIASGWATNATEKRVFLPFVEGAEGFSDITTRGSEGFSYITTREGKEFSESIKKGSISNATLWSGGPPDRDFCRVQKSTLEQNQQIAAPQVHHAGNIGGITYENFVGQPSGVSLAFFRCSPLSLRPQASSTQAEKLAEAFTSFSRSILASISSMSSCGNRMPLYEDLLFLCPVAIALAYVDMFVSDDNTGRLKISEVFKHKVIDVFKHHEIWYLNTLSTGKAQATHKITKPGSASTLTGPLTTNDRISIEVAVMDITTPLTGRASLTPNKFTWRFLAISRIDRNAKPCRMSVEAHTEREARQLLAPHFILSLSARLPVQETAHV